MKKILFADDEEALLSAMQGSLEEAGYMVITAPDGEKGLALCLEHQPDLVITDNQMSPVDGLEMVRGIRQAGATVPIIVHCSSLNGRLKAQYQEQGVKTFLDKPVTEEQLFQAVALELGQEQQSQTKT
ncbi:MAG: response regulator [Candidatus Kerfeldbacteria bacterium]|nr:response regulator [Candidatus Kerfeldbacteria bacterium]